MSRKPLPKEVGATYASIRKIAYVFWKIVWNPRIFLEARTQKGRLAGIDHELQGQNLAIFVFGPFCCASWTPHEKLHNLSKHFEIVRTCGQRFLPSKNSVRILCTLAGLDPEYSLRIDEAGWMICDGLTVLSLWKGIDRLFSVSFLLGRVDSKLVCFIGGLQGRAGDEMLTLYRDLTKQAHGMRPRDLTIELNRMVCVALGVEHIYAVSEAARNSRDPYYGAKGQAITSFNYDGAWLDRGGVQIDADWFELPTGPNRRSTEDIPAKKRNLYRQRYEMLDRLNNEIRRALN